MTGRPVEFRSLTKDSFPFLIVGYNEGTGERVWQQLVTGPGVLEVPAFGGIPVAIAMLTPDGAMTMTNSKQETIAQIENHPLALNLMRLLGEGYEEGEFDVPWSGR